MAGAAIPGQGGAHHVNEQWPAYWRALFEARGFVAYDFIRPALWDTPGVEPWYLQNSIGYFRGEVPTRIIERTERLVLDRLRAPAALVHPDMFARATDPLGQPVSVHAAGLAKTLRRKFSRALAS